MIIFKSKTGEIAIMTVVSDKDSAVLNFLEQHPEFVDWYEGNFELPTDRKFRDAWTLSNNKIVIDDKKSRQIHMEHVRKARNEKLAELDMEQLKHLTDNWKIQEIEQKKQLLRDLPAGIIGLEWPDGL